MAFTSCDDKLPDATPQSNPQQTVLEVDGLIATATVSENSPTIDLNQYKDSDLVSLLSFSTKDDVALPDSTKVSAVAEFANSEDFSDVYIIDMSDATTIAELKATDAKSFGVRSCDLDSIYKDLVTKNPTVENPMYVRYSILLTKDGQTTYAGGKKYPISRVAPVFKGKNVWDYAIETEYYVLTDDGGEYVASLTTAGDQYDNPEFKATFEVPAGGTKCLILPKSAYEEYKASGTIPTDAKYKSFGGSIADSLLVANNVGETAKRIEYGETGKKSITFNMDKLRFSFSAANDYLYTPGDANGWTIAESMKLRTSDYKTYQGFVFIQNQFKLTDAPDWNHGNYGGSDGKLVNGGSNILVSPDDLYYVTADIPNMTYKTVQIKAIGMTGSATTPEWNPSDAVVFTFDANTKTATATTTLKDGEVKFVFNNGWDINLGGTADDLVEGGANLAVSAGTYTITLDFSSLPYKATFQAQ